MPIIWTNDKDMYNKTKECFNKFDNIQAFFDIQNAIYTEYWESKGGKFEVDELGNFTCYSAPVAGDEIKTDKFDFKTKKYYQQLS